MGFTKAELEAFRDKTVPDLIGARLELLFVGINPGLWTAATQTHFCHPSNRFYPALAKAGLIDWQVEPSTGMTDEQRSAFTGSGMGITNLVRRATARASELGADELRSGGARLEALVERRRPDVVAVAGVTAFRTAFDEPKATLGPREDHMGASLVWILPNPSGLNAHETIETLAEKFRHAGQAAGLL